MVNIQDQLLWFPDLSEGDGGTVHFMDIETEVWRNGTVPTKVPLRERKTWAWNSGLCPCGAS